LYEPSWNSLRSRPEPQWFRDAKFGIYAHWGVYSVPACGPNATWYGYNMYREGSLQYNYHVRNFGDPSKFGYKDFIPLFTAEKFDPSEWAELFRRSGARFAGPVGEHHEGFSMWETRHSAWNAARMGPRRDVVGELAKEIRKTGLRYMVAMHHAETWWFYPHWKTDYDVSNPKYSGLYGEPHDMQWAGMGQSLDPNPYIANHEKFWPTQQKPAKVFLDRWLAKLEEVIDNYSPDLLWFDFGLRFVHEGYKKAFLAYYFNEAEKRGIDPAVVYKWHNLVPGCGFEDLEQGGRDELGYNAWITDTTIDNGEAWGYIYNNSYKSATTLIHYLIDNVSKNGALLLSIGPRPDGSIPEQVVDTLGAMGQWLGVCGEAIYGTTPWIQPCEGPNPGRATGPFSEYRQQEYSAADIRYTCKDDSLFAIVLGRPAGELVLAAPGTYLYDGEIASVSMLGSEAPIAWSLSAEGLRVRVPMTLPCDHAVAFRIERKKGPGGNCGFPENGAPTSRA
jgi:alpha-L-fucosidase